MRLDQLTGYVAFLSVARKGTFTAAAAELRVSTSAISQATSLLEEKLGVRLFDRTTRSVKLTEAGQAFLERIGTAADDLLKAADGIARFTDRPIGTLRVTTSQTAYRTLLAPAIPEFLAKYPDIRLEVTATDQLSDLVRDGFDCGIRLGENLEKDMVAVKLGPDIQSAIVASPKYFKKHPPPRVPEDLKAHNCIVHKFPDDGGIYRWELERNGRDLTIEVQGRLTLTDPAHQIEAAIQGVGIAYAFDINVKSHLAQGKLLRVLVPYCPRYPGFFLYYSHRKHLPAKLRVFIDFLRQMHGT